MMSMEHWWNNTDSGKPKYSEKNIPVPLYSPQMLHELSRDRTRVCTVRGVTTAWPMTSWRLE